MKKVVRIISIFLTVLISVLLLFGYNQNKDLIESNEIEKNDPYKQVTIGSKDDYYQLTIPREFRPNMSENSISIHNISYLGIKKWGDEIKDRESTIFFVRVTYNTGELSRNNRNNFFLENHIKKHYFLTDPKDKISKNLVKKNPNTKVYANKKNKEIGYYIFTDKNGLLVIAAVLGKISSNVSKGEEVRIYASYKEKLEIYFPLPKSLFYNMPDVTNSIIDLISSFEPTHYKNSSLITASDNSKK